MYDRKKMTEVLQQQNVKLVEATLEQAVETYLAVAFTNRSPKTKRWHASKLAVMVSELGRYKPLSTIGDMEVLQWYGQRAEKVSSPHTRHGYVRSVKQFFKWLVEMGVIGSSPASLLSLPRLPKVGRKGISDDDAEKMLAAAHRHVRDYAILCFLDVSNARLQGVAELRMEDLNVDVEDRELRRRVFVMEKNDERRTVFLNGRAYYALLRWLVKRPRKLKTVFGLTHWGIYSMLRRYAKNAGVQENWSTHQWRHRWGRKMHSRKTPLGKVAQMMGHKSPTITYQYYGQYGDEELQDTHEDHIWK